MGSAIEGVNEGQAAKPVTISLVGSSEGRWVGWGKAALGDGGQQKKRVDGGVMIGEKKDDTMNSQVRC